ncbi:MAG TPA: class I SAM-dependent methyltransferase [Thermoleophilaceae bacterium]
MLAAFAHWSLEPGAARVADVAAGTGRLTRELAAAGAEVTAVEPVDEMRAYIREARAVPGTAESLPFADAELDAVFAAEAFHWFDAPAALREFARVLRPGGGLALLWNVGLPQDEDQPWRQEVVERVRDVYYHPHGRRTPAASGNDPRDDTAEWRTGPGWELFEPLEQRSFEHVQRMTRDGYLAFVNSWSFVGAMEEGPRAELLGEVGAILDRHGAAEFEQRWRTDLYVTARRAG